MGSPEHSETIALLIQSSRAKIAYVLPSSLLPKCEIKVFFYALKFAVTTC